jgi:RNA polymerase sigma factor (sigma-70 family)
MDAFEAHRPHLHAVATRILGSRAEADDALQEAWIRIDRADTSEVDNIGGWLTTVVSRVCLSMLDARKRRREDALEAGRLPDPIVTLADDTAPDPEGEALAADAVGAALLVVLETLQPAERLAFVLHDVFAVPFDQIAPIVGRSPTATRQLASRARRRVQDAPMPDVDLDEQWAVVDAFLAAAREGDFERLVGVLDPDVVLRAEGRAGRPKLTQLVHGAREVASQAMLFRQFTDTATRILVNGLPGGVAWKGDGNPYAVLAMTVRGDRIVRIDVLADPDRLAELDLTPVAG